MGSKFGAASLQALAEYLTSIAPPGSGPAVFATLQGWHTTQVARKGGKTTGQCDTYYVASDGKRFRSRTDVARHFGLVQKPQRGQPKQLSHINLAPRWRWVTLLCAGCRAKTSDVHDFLTPSYTTAPPGLQ